jgi:hypothetical protein
MLYLLVVEDFAIYFNSVGIKQHEERIDEMFLKQSLFKIQEDAYYQKAIYNYLPNQIVLNLIGFPDKLAEAVQK